LYTGAVPRFDDGPDAPNPNILIKKNLKKRQEWQITQSLTK
jgi:hypothetical protein